MESAVRELFKRYELYFNQSICGDIDFNNITSLYASEFIGAAPVGVMTGKNDAQFKQALLKEYGVI